MAQKDTPQSSGFRSAMNRFRRKNEFYDFEADLLGSIELRFGHPKQRAEQNTNIHKKCFLILVFPETSILTKTSQKRSRISQIQYACLGNVPVLS